MPASDPRRRIVRADFIKVNDAKELPSSSEARLFVRYLMPSSRALNATSMSGSSIGGIGKNLIEAVISSL